MRVWIVVALIACQAPGLARAQQQAAEPFDRVVYVNLLLGANWPVGDTNVVFDPDWLTGGRIEYALTPLVRLGGQLSFHAFNAERGAAADNEGVIAMSAFAKALGVWGPYRPFALFGIGAYVSKQLETAGRRWDGGVQMGAGLEYPVAEHLSVTSGFGFHMVLRAGEQNDHLWIEGYLGFLFRGP